MPKLWDQLEAAFGSSDSEEDVEQDVPDMAPPSQETKIRTIFHGHSICQSQPNHA